MSGTPLPRIKGSVMTRQEGEEYYALNLDTGELYRMNRSGWDILRCCQRGLTVEQAVAEIASQYEPGQEEAILEDVRESVGRLREMGFVEE
ncbi:MAG: PqqD family protein [Acetobacteraceae bacterium]|nr:PqqD family protein [Acetobacteraceae bacterium]